MLVLGIFDAILEFFSSIGDTIDNIIQAVSQVLRLPEMVTRFFTWMPIGVQVAIGMGVVLLVAISIYKLITSIT